MLIQILPHGKSKLSVYKLVFRIRFKKLGVLIKLSLILVRRGTWLFDNFIVPPEIITMLGAKLSLVCSMISTVYAFNKSASRGCNLVIPQNVQEHPEPQPESGPLLLHIELSVLHIREIPDSGGSYGVDVW